jgi:hypothetical protein
MRTREVQEALQLGADPADVGLDRLRGVELPLDRLPAGVADHPRAAADHRDRSVAGALQVHEPHDRDQVADVQARRRGVEAAVAGHPSAGERLGEGIGVLVQHAAPGELGEEIVGRM